MSDRATRDRPSPAKPRHSRMFTGSTSPRRAWSRSDLWIGSFSLLGVLLLGLVLVLAGHAREVELGFVASEIEVLDERVFRVRLKGRLGTGWDLSGDRADWPPRSDLRLYEDGRLLGPARAQHQAIARLGQGRYSHWRDHLLFSTSDNSDPRFNGRVYSAILSTRLDRQIQSGLATAGALGLMLAVAAWLIREPRRVSLGLSRAWAHLVSRRRDYALAAAIPTGAALLLALLPPVWNGSDSVLWLMKQWEQFPHHAILYPAFMGTAQAWLTDATGLLRWALVAQHLLTIAAVTYLASAYHEPRPILILSMLGSLGLGFGLYAHGLYTEAMGLPFLLLMVGALIRLTRYGLTPRVGLALFIGLLGGILTRHAFLVFAVIPATYGIMVVLLSRRRWVWRAWLPAILLLAIIGVAFGSARLVTFSACAVLERDCVSITGRAGVYRMVDAHALVPPSSQDEWLARLAAAAPDPVVARAMIIMARAPEPWVGSMQAVAADPLTFGRDVDALMNAAFWTFVRSGDPYMLRQWADELGKALFGFARDERSAQGQFSQILAASARTILDVARNDEPEILAALQGTGAERPESAAQYESLARALPTRMLDWSLPLDPLGRSVLLLASLTLMLAVIGQRGLAPVSLLLASLWLGILVYALALSFATVILPRYLAPLDLLIWLSNAVALIALLERADGSARQDLAAH